MNIDQWTDIELKTWKTLFLFKQHLPRLLKAEGGGGVGTSNYGYIYIHDRVFFLFITFRRSPGISRSVEITTSCFCLYSNNSPSTRWPSTATDTEVISRRSKYQRKISRIKYVLDSIEYVIVFAFDMLWIGDYYYCILPCGTASLRVQCDIAYNLILS